MMGVEDGLDLAVHLHQAELAVGLGRGDEGPSPGALVAVGVEEGDVGEEVRTGEAGVGMRAFQLQRPAAEPVGQGLLGPPQTLLHPLAGGGVAVRVIDDQTAVAGARDRL